MTINTTTEAGKFGIVIACLWAINSAPATARAIIFDWIKLRWDEFESELKHKLVRESFYSDNFESSVEFISWMYNKLSRREQTSAIDAAHGYSSAERDRRRSLLVTAAGNKNV